MRPIFALAAAAIVAATASAPIINEPAVFAATMPLAQTATTTTTTTVATTTTVPDVAPKPAGSLAEAMRATIGDNPRLWDDHTQIDPPPPLPDLDSPTADIKTYVREQALHGYGWGDDQWPHLEGLWQRESGWNPRADNPNSTAWGLGQWLASTARNYSRAWGYQIDHPDYNGRIPTLQAQTENGLRYIHERYGTPADALAFWKRQCGSRSGCWY